MRGYFEIFVYEVSRVDCMCNCTIYWCDTQRLPVLSDYVGYISSFCGIVEFIWRHTSVLAIKHLPHTIFNITGMSVIYLHGALLPNTSMY